MPFLEGMRARWSSPKCQFVLISVEDEPPYSDALRSFNLSCTLCDQSSTMCEESRASWDGRRKGTVLLR